MSAVPALGPVRCPCGCGAMLHHATRPAAAKAVAKDGAVLPLSPGQRRALTILQGKAAHIVNPGHELEAHHITYATAERLVVLGYARPIPRDPDVHPPHGAVVITPAGRKALGRPLPHTPVYLRARDGLTTMRTSAVIDEGEVIDSSTLGTWWDEQAAQREAAAGNRRDAARRLRNQARGATLS